MMGSGSNNYGRPWKLHLVFALLTTSILLYIATAMPPPIRIACGMSRNSYDDMSREWIGDANLVNNNQSNLQLVLTPKNDISTPTTSFSTSKLPKYAPFISSRVFYSKATYTFKNVSPGRYFLRFWFVDIGSSTYRIEDAMFSVILDVNIKIINNINLNNVINHFKGSPGTGYCLKEYIIDISRPFFNLTFIPSFSRSANSFALVSGIELQPFPEDVFPTLAKDVSTLQNINLPTKNKYTYETVYRMNIGGQESSQQLHDGLGRKWSNDDANYLTNSQVNMTIDRATDLSIMSYGTLDPLTAPLRVYMSARAMPYENEEDNTKSSLSWTLQADPGYAYVIRLHLCELKYWRQLERPKETRTFKVSINNKDVEQGLDVLNATWTPKYDVVMVKDYYIDSSSMGGKELHLDLRPVVSQNANGTLVHSNVMLNGLEVFQGFSTSTNE